MERIVRNGIDWVDENGAVIDPVILIEYYQSSSRFVSACAVLLYHGRCMEYKEKIFRVMDHCCGGLYRPDSVNRSPDFWMRELATAYFCLKDIAPPERVKKWREDLAKVDPEVNYKFVSSDPVQRHTFHNWAVYASAGESMRETYGISGPQGALWGKRFFDEYIRHQWWRFNEYGMYRDPGDPFTYDITTRLQLETALHAGYNGIWKDGLRRVLDDAMFTTLLFMPPSGQVPYGGRSSQFYFQEGIISALCELAAVRYKKNEPVLAGAFKRQAHLSALAVREGLLRDDGKLFHLKNYFSAESRHGCDQYGHYSAYSLLAGSFFALAALFSDDTIAETPAVSEIGGYLFQITNSFYKVFCNQAGNYLEFDLRPDPAYDACGLGRILMKDLPWGLLPVMGFAREGNYCIAPEFSPNQYATAVAPEWDDKNGIHRRMADYSAVPSAPHLPKGPETLSQDDIKELEPGVWQISYEMWEAKVIYTADLRKDNQVLLTLHISGDVQNAAMIVPVLKFDGSHRPQTELSGSGFTSLMSGQTLICTTNGRKADFSGTAVNRTGIYDRIRIRFSGSELKLVLQVR